VVGTARAAVALLVFLAGLAGARPAAFGAVGLDWCRTSGVFYTGYDSLQVPLEPAFRVGAFVAPGLAVGADLTLVGVFPKNENPLLNTPCFAFGPNVTYFPGFTGRHVRAYATAGLSYYYVSGWRGGLRTLLAVGAGWVFPRVRVSPGLELGWRHDELGHPWNRGEFLPGNVLFAGFRLTGVR
jgi:hypothetical protein